VTRQERLARIRPCLACPACHAALTEAADVLRCEACGRDYAVRDGRIHFSPPLVGDDKLDNLKGRLKRSLGSLYYTVGVQFLGPNYPFNYKKKILAFVDPASALVVDIGAGNRRVTDDVIALDAVPYDATDIVADVSALPFKTGSIDCFASRSVLEHVAEPHVAVAEMRRCTRADGLNIHYTPFLFPYHAAPHDYHRFTHTGFLSMYRGWLVREQYNSSGPVSLALIMLAESVATLLSGGIESVKAYLYLLVGLAVCPFKFLDWPFIGRRAMLSLAPTIVTVVQKRDA